MKIIESAELIEKYQIKLKDMLFFKADKRPKPILTWKSPNGKLHYEVNYISKLNLWGCYISNPHQSFRHWNGYGIGEPISDKPLSTDLTISFPVDERDRNQGGAFVESKNGDILICHSGNIYGGQDLFWDNYKGDELICEYSDGTNKRFACVANLDPTNCFREIALFVKQVNAIKRNK
jgi:hypothetical protein